MKAIIVTITFILVGSAYANNLCFENPEVKEAIRISEFLDKCFSQDSDNCGLSNSALGKQKRTNLRRLVPFDRASNKFMDRATGRVRVEFGRYGGEFSGKFVTGSAQKISRCHIVTAAHLFYKDGAFPIESDQYEVGFESGQTCNPAKKFENIQSAKIVFRMAKAQLDFGCDLDRYGNCRRRHFFPHSDIVILKLQNFDRSDSNFFNLNIEKQTELRAGQPSQRVNCWGYPAHNESLSVPSELSDMYLWSQKDAQIFGESSGNNGPAIITNAIGYRGMSGGGCVAASSPKVLVGIFSKNNGSDGVPAVYVAPGTQYAEEANYLSGFHRLAQRYKSETRSLQFPNGKNLADIDSECSAK